MKIVRILLGVVSICWGLWSLVPVVSTAAYKLGQLPDSAEVHRLIPLFQATPWWMVAVWLAEIALYLVAGWRLIRGRPALRVFIAAVAIGAALWWIMSRTPQYQQAFTPAELQLDYWIFAVEAALIAAIALVERRRPA
jgi:hypothetical protein